MVLAFAASAKVDEVDALNLQVRKQISSAEASKNIRPEHAFAASDAKAGVLVYKERSRWLVYVLHVVALCGIASARSVPLLLFWGAFMYFYLDFYGGLLHFVLDHAGNLGLPVIGPACLEFQWHHNIPQDITSQPFVEVAGALNVLAVAKWSSVALAAYLAPASVARDLPLVMAWGYFWGIVGQWSHRQAHCTAEKRAPWSAWLQRAGVLLDPSDHRSHHAAAFDEPHKDDFGRTYPILHGKSGRVLEFVLLALPSPAFWTGSWVVLTVVDIVVFTTVFNAVIGL